MEKILIIDDNESIRYSLVALLESEGYYPFAVEDGPSGIDELKKNIYNLIILDLKLPDIDGMEILKRIREINQHIPVIMLTAFGDIKSAVASIKEGAQDFITKPFDNDVLILSIKKTLEFSYLKEEVKVIRKKLDKTNIQDNIIGLSPAMLDVFDQVKIVAPTNLTVLIQGESGTGKEVIANMIHTQSDRSSGPLIAVDCGAIPENLMESELFGHEKGAFTDAKTSKEGKFELANSGTIFLDEITNLSDAHQIKLLRVIQERKVTRVGGKKPLDLNVRIITASNVNLVEAVSNKKFREDLYYRLNEFHLDLPPLRDRKEDIPLFIDSFIKEANKELGKSVDKVSPEIFNKLLNHKWTGNVREFRNVIRRAVLLCQGNEITNVSLPEEIISSYKKEMTETEQNNSAFSLNESTQKIERELILKALEESGGNKSKAAQILNMSERTLYRKINSLNIDLK